MTPMRLFLYVFIGVFVLAWVAVFVSLFGDNDTVNIEKVVSFSRRRPIPVDDVTADPDAAIHQETKQLNDVAFHPNLRQQIVSTHEVPKTQAPKLIHDSKISLDEVERNVTIYLQTLHETLSSIAGPKVDAKLAWEAYRTVTSSTYMEWDEANKHRLNVPRKDNTIFVSLGTYRDPFCPMTIKSLYSQASHPEKVTVGLFQQNCFGPKCRTGVLVGGKVEDAGPDINCYEEFCKSTEGIKSKACTNGNVRLFNVNESESLGPYMARYLGAKFYMGEQYYLQIDSHSEFIPGWDEKLIKMVVDAPAEKPVISTYPPDSHMDWKGTIGYRMCNCGYAKDPIEHHIIRLGTARIMDHEIPKVPKYAPFVAAGFFFTVADFLLEVPFDPFLPWIFMGEEISMSARLWTSGYDIFAPTVNVLNHYYVRRHYPKFWESVNRFFKKPIHNGLTRIILNRIKNMLQYPESATNLVDPTSILYESQRWGLGAKRPYSEYLALAGLDMDKKVTTTNKWCFEGKWPSQCDAYYRPNLSGQVKLVGATYL